MTDSSSGVAHLSRQAAAAKTGLQCHSTVCLVSVMLCVPQLGSYSSLTDVYRWLSCVHLPKQTRMHLLQPCLPTRHHRRLLHWQLLRCCKRSLVRPLGQAMQIMLLAKDALLVQTGGSCFLMETIVSRVDRKHCALATWQITGPHKTGLLMVQHTSIYNHDSAHSLTP